MDITYPNRLRNQFFLYGAIERPRLRSYLGFIIDTERQQFRQHFAPVSPLERLMIAELAGVSLALRSDGYETEHPDYARSYADLVNRLANLKPTHPFSTKGRSAMDEYLNFLLDMTHMNLTWSERYLTGNAGRVPLMLAGQSEFTLGSLRHA